MSVPAPPVLWEPSRESVEQTTIWRFPQANGFSDYPATRRWC